VDEKIVTNPEEILKLRDEIMARWEHLPPEHQATMLVVLLDESSWANWSSRAAMLLEENEGEEAPP